MVGVTPEDLEMAHKLISTSPGYLSKWTKQELTSAAVALRLFVRRLPGGPKLLRRAADLASSAPGEEAERMDHAVKAIERQEGVDASLYRLQAEEDPAATSTQVPGAGGRGAGAPDASLIAGRGGSSGGNGGGRDGVEKDVEEGLSYSQIPSGQGGAGGGESSSSRHNNRNYSSSNDGDDNSSADGSNTTTDGKVSDPSSSSAHSLAAPIRTTAPHGPHKRAQEGGNGVGVVDAGMSDVGVAGGGGVGGVDAGGGARKTKKGSNPANNTTRPRNTSEWRPRVCNQVWRGGTCNNMSKGCRFAHPNPCSDSGCASAPAPTCRAFHPKRRGNGRGSVRKGGDVPGRREDTKLPRPSGTNSGTNIGSNIGSNSNLSRSATLQLRERLEAMEKRLGLKEKGRSNIVGERRPSYRDVAARGLSRGGSGDTNPFNPNRGRSGANGDSALVRPDPAVLSTVVAAVMAVLSTGQHF